MFERYLLAVERLTVKTFHEVHKDQVTDTIKVEVHIKLQVDDTGNSSPSVTSRLPCHCAYWLPLEFHKPSEFL